MSKVILGISAYYHDSAAALIEDGKIIAAAQEERFSRKKHDPGFPANAVRYVLSESSVDTGNLYAVAFYDKPYLKLERLLETYHAFTPRGLISFLSAIPVWIKEKLFMKKMLRDELVKLGIDKKVKLLFPEHHLSHAASAFYPSRFDNAAILTIDGVGEWATTTICKGENNTISILSELTFPHSLGLLYSAFTYYTGFKVNSGEYKLMGLAPYGIPGSSRVERYKAVIRDYLADIKADGSLLLNMKYFNFATGLRMTHDKKWTKLFDLPPRKPESEITQAYMDMALAVQQITEEVIIKLARTAKEQTGCDNLVMAGGVALNSVANGKLLKEKIFKDIWIQPAAGDAGGALGAALAAWYIWDQNPREVTHDHDAMSGAYLGPSFKNTDIVKTMKKYNANAGYFEDFNELTRITAGYIADNKVVGWFQGRMEYGPRALGNRSILGDARNPEMQRRMNLKIKYREGFRPFAPSVLEEDMAQYFDISQSSPYMLFVVPVQEAIKNELPGNYYELDLYNRLYIQRSSVPAVTHIDFSARLQSIGKTVNPKFRELIGAFKDITGHGILINTSFNVRGEPIVCTPEDAYRCFMRTDMDYLVMDHYIFDKSQQKIENSNMTNSGLFRPD